MLSNVKSLISQSFSNLLNQGKYLMMGGILLYPAMLRLLLWPPVPGRDGAGSGRAARRYHFSMRGPDVLGVQGNFPDADYFTATLRDFLVASRQQHIEMRILFFPVKFLHQRFSGIYFAVTVYPRRADIGRVIGLRSPTPIMSGCVRAHSEKPEAHA